MKTTLKAVLKFLAGLSKPSKMPCYGYSISAFACKMGGRLRLVKGSVCATCYATKGNYRFDNVQLCHDKRLTAFNQPEFVPNMVFAINKLERSGYFRWFDSGDVQDLAMLEKIADVAKQTPSVRHWLPTKEYAIVLAYLRKHGAFPDNLTVRLSAYLVNQKGPVALAKRYGLTVSEVRTDNYTCPASKQGNKCLLCRACWDKAIMTVAYHKH